MSVFDRRTLINQNFDGQNLNDPSFVQTSKDRRRLLSIIWDENAAECDHY